MTVGGLQYEWPLAGDYFRGALFYDVGTLVTEPGDLTLGQFRHSVGTGIRFVIPPPLNWPISLDFAIPLKKEKGDDTQVISFSLGRTM